MSNTTKTAINPRMFRGIDLSGLGADELRKLVDLAWHWAQIEGRKAPAMTLERDKEGYVEGLRCPHCGSVEREVYDQDVSVRWTNCEIDDPIEPDEDKHEAYLSGRYEGGEHEGELFISTCCERVVKMPQGVEHVFN